jgi:hypothetical protein
MYFFAAMYDKQINGINEKKVKKKSEKSKPNGVKTGARNNQTTSKIKIKVPFIVNLILYI